MDIPEEDWKSQFVERQMLTNQAVMFPIPQNRSDKGSTNIPDQCIAFYFIEPFKPVLPSGCRLPEGSTGLKGSTQ